MAAEGIDLVELMKEASRRCLEKSEGDVDRFKECLLDEIEQATKMARNRR